jgi:chemotaxis response regulator CheB
MATGPRILTAGDRRLVFGTLAKLLEARFEIVGTAANRKELLNVAARLEPDRAFLRWREEK